MQISRKPGSPARRSAFTLTELLVVIAIIAILAALLGAGIYSWIGVQQRRNSESGIRDVTKVLQGQWSWVINQAKKETPSPAVQLMAGSDPTGARAKVLWIKVRLMEAFPLNYSEINGTGNPKNPDPVNTFLYGGAQPVIPLGQQKYLKAYQDALASATNPYQDATGASTTESSACLLIALSVARGGVSLSPDNLGRFVADTDGDGIKEIVDGFSNPVSFYRFAWGTTAMQFADNSVLAYPGIQGLNPAPGNVSNKYSTWSKGFKLGDPVDPDGLLTSWSSGAFVSQFASLFHPITVTLTDGSNQKWPVATYVFPLVVSNGKDGKLGLPAPRSCAALGIVQALPDAQDNIYSFKIMGN